MSIWETILQNPLYFDLVFPTPVFLLGLFLVLFHKFRFSVIPNYIAYSTKSLKVYRPGWHWALNPEHLSEVYTAPKFLNIPQSEKPLEITTPDEGILAVKVSISYKPDDSSGEQLMQYKATGISNILESRVKSALQGWAWQKGFPATSRQAVASKEEAEKSILSKLTGVRSESPTLAIAVFGDTEPLNRYAIQDLGIVISEVHIVEFWEVRKGTGKANWGDGDQSTFNAQAIFKQFHAHADNLSNLRKLKEKLIENYPNEAEDIEDIYDNVRISMKENRD